MGDSGVRAAHQQGNVLVLFLLPWLTQCPPAHDALGCVPFTEGVCSSWVPDWQGRTVKGSSQAGSTRAQVSRTVGLPMLSASQVAAQHHQVPRLQALGVGCLFLLLGSFSAPSLSLEASFFVRNLWIGGGLWWEKAENGRIILDYLWVFISCSFCASLPGMNKILLHKGSGCLCHFASRSSGVFLRIKH